MTLPRQPRGIPIGGQYAARHRAESDVELAADLTPVPHGELTAYRHPNLIEPTEPTEKVLDAIERAGGRPLMVGGCVRDALLGDRHPKDIDIEVYGVNDTDRLVNELRREGRVDEVGVSFGVMQVLVHGEDFDVSLPRRERKTGTGHKGFEIEIGDIDPVDATGRRDFTVNAMMYDPRRGEIVDCWGGRSDLDSGVLRHMTDAFADDPLRVLRGVRFASKYGWELDEDTAEFCAAIFDDYRTLPPSRLWGEWSRITAEGSHMTTMLRQLDRTGWIEHYPQLAVLRTVSQDRHWHPEGNVFVHTGLSGDQAAAIADRDGLTGDERTVVVMAAMLHDFGKATHTQYNVFTHQRITSHGHAEAGAKPAREFMDSIGTPHHIRDRVLPLVTEHMSGISVEGDPTNKAVAKLARRLAPATMREWAAVVEADRNGRGPVGQYDGYAHRWVHIAKGLGVHERPSARVLTGDVLIGAGMKPGPQFRTILDASIEAQDAGEFRDEAGARAWFERTYLGR